MNALPPIPPEAIHAAARWWADQLRTRTKQDNGDSMTELLVMLAHKAPDLTKVDVFEAELRERFASAFSNRLDRTVSTDYGPLHLALIDACRVAGIPAQCPPFPMKTVMWIDQDAVRVRHGYGAWVRVIWRAEDDTALAVRKFIELMARIRHTNHSRKGRSRKQRKAFRASVLRGYAISVGKQHPRA